MNDSMTTPDKLAASIAMLGVRYVLHPQYKPLPYQSPTHKQSHFLTPVKMKAMQEGRLAG